MKRWRDESACSYCGDDGLGKKDAERMGRERVVLLHNVHHNGSFRLLCTNCVLINHPGLFCPICLLPFDSTPPLPVSHRLMCLRCPSIAHPSCSSSSSSSSSFLCPPCSSLHPSRFRFFSTTAATLQKENAKALVAAATISASSLHRAALAARADADRLLSDALSAKKRAVQALDLLSRLISSPPLPTPTISPPSFDQHHPQT